MLRYLTFALLVFAWTVSVHAQTPDRIVFLGDSITDGFTYPLMVRQALTEAGKAVPVCINAGVASDTAKQMRARLDRDVLAHRPTKVTLSAGINDVLRNVSAEDYEADVAGIAETLKGKGIELVLMTPTVLGPKHEAADKRLADFIAGQRRIAQKHGLKIAEVNALMQAARGKGETVLEPDQVHINLPGYRLMTRAVLDALGHETVQVPAELKVELMPGVFRQWHLRVAPETGGPLDEAAAAALSADDSWKKVAVPEAEKQEQWWFENERQRGVVLGLKKQVGDGKSWQGIAVLESREPRKVYFNTGAQLQTTWLNGKRIYKNEGWTGWHAGKERIAADLKAGENRVVIETGGEFFLSVTDTNDW